MGTPVFAIPILQSIINSNHNILQVYTQPPKKKNRGQKITTSPIHEFSKKNNLNVIHPEKLGEEEYLRIKKLKPDLIVVVAYGKIIPTKFLEIKNLNFLNVHASLLPKWRGAAPIQRALMNLDSETGISIMKIIPELDAGPILMKSKIKLSKETDYETLSRDMSLLGAKMIINSLNLIEKNEAKFTPQNNKDATYAKKITKVEAKIDWKIEAKKILGKINALNPNPGPWFEIDGVRIKVIKAIEVKAKGSPGEVLNNSLTIACLDNAIQILKLKKEGKSIMTASEFLNGNKLKIGSNVSGAF